LREYVQFSNCYFKFEKNIYLPLKLHEIKYNKQSDILLNNYSDNKNSDFSWLNDCYRQETELPINGNILTIVLHVMKINGLSLIFSTLYEAIKIGVTLPVASATTQRIFSKH